MPEIEATMTRSELKERWRNFLEGTANDMVNKLIDRCPVDKGWLRNSISYVVDSKSITISMLYYGLYVEFGTPPHIITPVNKKALHWKEGGTDVFAKIVHHPGTMPQPFIRPLLERDLPEILSNNFRTHVMRQ